MTIPVVSAAIQAILPPIPKLVLIDLADHADRDGRNSFPGLKRISRETCTTKNTVRSYLKKLELYGFIAKQDFPEEYAAKYPANHRPQCWQVLLDEHGQCLGRWPPKDGDDLDSESGTTTGPRGANGEGQEMDPRPARGANDGVQGCKSEGPGVQELCTQPINNQSKPSAAMPAGAAPDGAPADGEGETLISRWRALEPWVERRLGVGIWRSWFQRVIVAELTEEVITLEAPTRFIADYFRQHYAEALGERLGRKVVIGLSKRAYARANPKPKEARANHG